MKTKKFIAIAALSALGILGVEHIIISPYCLVINIELGIEFKV